MYFMLNCKIGDPEVHIYSKLRNWGELANYIFFRQNSAPELYIFTLNLEMGAPEPYILTLNLKNGSPVLYIFTLNWEMDAPDRAIYFYAKLGTWGP